MFSMNIFTFYELQLHPKSFKQLTEQISTWKSIDEETKSYIFDTYDDFYQTCPTIINQIQHRNWNDKDIKFIGYSKSSPSTSTPDIEQVFFIIHPKSNQILIKNVSTWF